MSILSAAEQRKKVLEQLVPDTTFSGSLEDIKAKANNILDSYESKLPQIPQIPTIPSLIPELVPPVPSYAEVKETINTKIQKAKKDSQEAFISAQTTAIERAKNPFAARRDLVNSNTRRVVNVLGRFNNR